ncbi:MAG: hydroxyethylthiazole kinase [Brotaphodocola sp.]
MNNMDDKLYSVLESVRELQPLVECITNFVTVNDCANILLAAGASPTMSHDVREVEESVAAVRALVCNLGAVDRVESMILAGKKANELCTPVVFDPVGAGATTLRRESSARLLKEVKFAAIRGNASEIRALAQGWRMGHQSLEDKADLSDEEHRNCTKYGSGVDVGQMDVITEENLSQSVKLVQQLAKETGAVIAVSGVIDVISDGSQTMVLRNGCSMMSRITGSGCMLTTLIGAFCGAVRAYDTTQYGNSHQTKSGVPGCGSDRFFHAVCAAMSVMGICGELADERRLRNGTGNATFRIDLIDAVFNLNQEQFKEKIRYEIYKG